MHIADGIDMHHQRHARDHDHHHRRHRIDQEADGKIQTAHRQPSIDILVKLGAAAVDKAPQHISRQHGGHRHAEYRNRMRAGTSDFYCRTNPQSASLPKARGQ